MSENSDPRPARESQEDEYRVGQRSITHRKSPGRRELLRRSRESRLKSRPFIIGAVVFVVALIAVPAYAYVQTFVMPPRQLAVRVDDVKYTRGDVVDFIRFNQRLSEDLGVPFEVGTSLFDALQTLQDNEIAFKLAPSLGITVEPDEVDERIESILGFVAENSAERRSSEYQVSVEEAKRQFLNKVGLPEEVYRDFVKKSMFKERLRSHVADTVDRVQAQVRVYQIKLFELDEQVLSLIDRELASGTPTEEIVLEFSEDPNVKRHKGDMGWRPFGITPDLDRLLFGLDEDGNRLLPVRTASEPRANSDEDSWTVYIVDEVVDAREIEPDHLEPLTDRAMTIFMNERRNDFDLFLDVDNEIYDWVNEQVRLASLLPPTPTPSSVFDDQFIGADDLPR